MTCKEKFLKEHPEYDEKDVAFEACPDEEGYIPCSKCKCVATRERIKYQTLRMSPKEICEDCWNQKACPTVWQIILIVGGVLALLAGLIGFGIHVFAAEPPTETIDISVVDTLEIPSTDEPIDTIDEELIFEEPETVMETIAETEPVVPAVRYFNVPLFDHTVNEYRPMSEDLQDHIFAVCENRGVDPLLVMAIIQKESTYGKYLYGDNGNSFGLMQIQPRWHSARMERLGCSDLLDPYQNVTVGIDILAELFGMGGSLDWVLMSYNGGYAHANNHIAAGTISDYAATVKYYMNTIERN